jgi:hypothetical protein
MLATRIPTCINGFFHKIQIQTSLHDQADGCRKADHLLVVGLTVTAQQTALEVFSIGFDTSCRGFVRHRRLTSKVEQIPQQAPAPAAPRAMLTMLVAVVAVVIIVMVLAAAFAAEPSRIGRHALH